MDFLETVYKQNINIVGWANKRFIQTTHQLENFAYPTKLAFSVSLTNTFFKDEVISNFI